MNSEFTDTGMVSPTSSSVVIIPTDLLNEFDHSKDYDTFTKRLKHIDGTTLFEPCPGTDICPNWETFVPKYQKTFNQLRRENALIEEETRPRNDLSAESVFRAITKGLLAVRKIGRESRQAWVLRISNFEQDTPVFTSNVEGGFFFRSLDVEEWNPTLDEVKAFDITGTIPSGEYTVFSPILNFENEKWFSFSTKTSLVIRQLISPDRYLAGMYLSEN